MSYPKCAAFVINQENGCGYLKTAATGLEASTRDSPRLTYCMNSRGAGCTGKMEE
jgi:hypothetical protein